MSDNIDKDELKDDIEETKEKAQQETADEDSHSDYRWQKGGEESDTKNLSGMFYRWFLDYSSYVNLNRAIPYITDGFKPVQRRVMHAMRRLEDGRYNKVANIVGHTMQFHPHGDASIYSALVGLGQKNLLIDTQGNWGNILTGDGAAAARYIEARLSKFALEAVFNPKTTEWKPSYDGRNQEPVALPVKFPLLLQQGVEGIGLGLNSKILPHNFNELIDASILYLQGEEFTLYPDFQTGGMIDVSRYRDGERGGRVQVRAKITKSQDNRSLIITDIPYGETTDSLIESIIRASTKGKINIKKIDDNTAENVEIVVHLEPKTSSDKTIDALYAFTNCQVSVSPNCCVVDHDKPVFITVSEVLRRSTDNTVDLLKRELEIERSELIEQLLSLSLEQIFIDERIYKDKEFENAKNIDAALSHIDKRIEPYKKDFIREITRDDLAKLLEIRMAKILKFNTDKANETIVGLRDKIDEVDRNLNNLIEYSIAWFEHLKASYGKNYPRLTEIRSFENIEVTRVVEANEKLYVDYKEGFIGTNLRKEEGVEFVQNCSNIDDIIVFFGDGKYKIVRVAEKLFVGTDIKHVAVHKRNDKRTIYNVVYRDGKNGVYYLKRFFVSGVTRDKDYDLTTGKPDSKIVYFSANPNGEAEIVRIELRPTSRRIRKMKWDVDFSDIAIKGRTARGNLLTKFPVSRITLKQEGGSTLGGRKIWYDPDVMKINNEERGEFLGEFFSDDQILVICSNGEFYTTNFDLTNHFEDDLLKIEKFDPDKIWSVALYDADQGYDYIKRFKFEPSAKRQSFIGENEKSMFKLISDDVYPLFKVYFGGKDAEREPLEIDVEQFVGDKSFRAKGKRIANFEVANVERLQPLRMPEPEEEPELDETKQPEGSSFDFEDEEDMQQGSLF